MKKLMTIMIASMAIIGANFTKAEVVVINHGDGVYKVADVREDGKHGVAGARGTYHSEEEAKKAAAKATGKKPEDIKTQDANSVWDPDGSFGENTNPFKGELSDIIRIMIPDSAKLSEDELNQLADLILEEMFM